MTESQISNAIGSVSTTPVAAESKEEQANRVKLYSVPVIADVSMNLTGYVNVYAFNEDEAFNRVQAQIDAETLDGDLQMEDADSGNTMRYDEVKFCRGIDIQIEDAEIEIVESDVDPADVLEAEVEELQASIAWNTGSLAKHKAFLESLLVNDESGQVVTA